MPYIARVPFNCATKDPPLKGTSGETEGSN
jgi:hypothetical protein